MDGIRRQLDSAIKRASLPNLPDEVRADLAKLLCIRTSGFVERSFAELASRLADRRADPKIATFVESKVGRTTNLSSKKLVSALREFDSSWADNMGAFLESDDEAKTALDSVVGKRHRIAHGHNDGVSVTSVSAWFRAVDRVVVHLESLLDPP